MHIPSTPLPQLVTPISCNAQAAVQAAAAAATAASSGSGGRKTLTTSPGSPPLPRDATGATGTGNPYMRQSRAPSSVSVAGIGDFVHDESVPRGGAGGPGLGSALSGNSGGGSGGASSVSNSVSGVISGGACVCRDARGLSCARLCAMR